MGTILKAILFIFLGYLVVGIVLAFKQMKKTQDQNMEEYLAKQEKYKDFSVDLLKSLEDHELKEAVLMHIFNKEDMDFEHLKENLNEGELVVYTIYQMENAVNHGKGNVHQFFDGPSKVYAPHLVDSYKAIGCDKMAELMEKIIKLIYQEQSGMLSENLGEDAPSFQEYTFDYMDLYEPQGVETKTTNYIKFHPELFID